MNKTRYLSQLVAPGTAAPVSTTSSRVPVTTSAKSPVSLFTILTGMGIAAIAALQFSQK